MRQVMARVRLKDVNTAEIELGQMLNRYAGHKDLAAMVHEVVEEYRNAGFYEEGRGLFAWLIENWDEGAGTMLELQVGIALQSIKLGEFDKAEAATAKLIADYNDNENIAKGLFQIGEEYFYAKKYPETIRLLELIDSNYPDKEFPAKNELAELVSGFSWEEVKKDASREEVLAWWEKNKQRWTIPFDKIEDPNQPTGTP